MTSSRAIPELAFPPLFVCGIQRSGTTLLVKILSRHQGISFLPQETHLYPLFWDPGNRTVRKLNSGQLSEALKTKLPQVNYGWTKAMPFLDAICEQIRSDNYTADSVESLLAYFLRFHERREGGNVRTGEKTPSHIYYALKKLKAFPECKIVVMYRDPRAAALSELTKLDNNTRTDRSFNTFNFIVRWATAMAFMVHIRGRQQVSLLRYEDLIADPENSVKKITDFVGFSFDKSLLDVDVTNSSFQDSEQRGKGFNMENLDRWQTELPEEVIRLIDYHLGDMMLQHGYEPVSGSGPDMPFSRIASQKTKLKIALAAAVTAPARFHHMNRNRKYRL